jgi:hypothetical protein
MSINGKDDRIGKVLDNGVKALNNAANTTAALKNAIGVTDRGASPVLVASGKEAMEQVSKILPNAVPITVSELGWNELRPGTIWDGNKMLIKVSPSTCTYIIDDRLYQISTSNFLRDIWFGALKKAANNASFMVSLVEAEIALLQGLIVPVWITLGLTVARLAFFVINNFSLIREAANESPNTLRLLHQFMTRHPKLFKTLLFTSAKEIIINLPKGLKKEDVGFFIGRVMRQLKEVTMKGIEIGLKVILKIIAKVALVVSAIRLPKISSEAIREAAGKYKKELQQKLAEEGVNISEGEAELILEHILRDQNAVKLLTDLEKSIEKLIPLAEALERSRPWLLR